MAGEGDDAVAVGGTKPGRIPGGGIVAPVPRLEGRGDCDMAARLAQTHLSTTCAQSSRRTLERRQFGRGRRVWRTSDPSPKTTNENDTETQVPPRRRTVMRGARRRHLPSAFSSIEHGQVLSPVDQVMKRW